MAPNSELSKRTRLRPSDWWAAPASSSTPKQASAQAIEDEGRAKKARRASENEQHAKDRAQDGARVLKQGEKIASKESPARAYRKVREKKGKKEKEIVQRDDQDDDDADADELLGGAQVERRGNEGESSALRNTRERQPTGKGMQTKPRSSNRAIAGPKGNNTIPNKSISNKDSEQLRSTNETIVENDGKSRIATKHDAKTTLGQSEPADQEPAIQAEPKRPRISGGNAKKRPGTPPILEQHSGEELPAEEPVREAISLRRGRSSNTEAELQAVYEAAIWGDIGHKKRGKGLTKAIEPDELVLGENRIGQDKGVKERHDDPFGPEQEDAIEGSTTGGAKNEQQGKLLAAQHEPEEEPQTAQDNSTHKQAAKIKKSKRFSDAEVLQAELRFMERVSGQEQTTTRTRYSNNTPSRIQGNSSSKTAQGNDSGNKRRRNMELQDAALEAFNQSNSRKQNENRKLVRVSNKQGIGKSVAKSSTKVKARTSQGSHRLSKEIIGVEAATSNLNKSRSKPSSRVARRSSIAHNLGKSMKSKTAETSKRASNHNASHEPSGRKRKSKDSRENTESDGETAKRRRVTKSSQPDDEEILEEVSPPYPRLAAVTRRISRQTIKTKWESLRPACVGHISYLLQDLQRPVVVRLTDEKKRNQASAALQILSGRLLRKISRGLPFPPGTRRHKEDDFDFENILDHNRNLEVQLTPALHANELLEAELRKEMAYLESEKDTLAWLKDMARKEASSRHPAARQMHALLQSEDSTVEVDILNDNIGANTKPEALPIEFAIQNDDNLQSLVDDLGGHVDSIQGNLKQVHGISHAIAKSKAAVQADLFARLNTTLYEELILGSD